MDTLPSEIRILIKKASEWPQPHNLNHIKPADGKLCGSTNNQHVLPNTDLFPFSEFISKYMNGPFTFHEEPTKKPLLSKLPQSHVYGALEVSKIVIFLTTGNNLNLAEQRLLSDYLSCRSISCQELRDETILQILSQTSGKKLGSLPSSDPPPPPPPPLPTLPSANNGAKVLTDVNNGCDLISWVLLADCLSCVKPSFNFQNYILSYLTTASGDGYEVLCLNKLQQNCSSGEECLRYYPPCLLEKFANQNHCFMALSCSFSDETIGCGQVSSWTLAKELASSLLRDIKNIPVNHASGWTVALRDQQGLYECQSDDFVMDLISELEVPAIFCSQPANFLVTKFSKTSSGRYINGEHPHNIQKKRLLLTEPIKHSSMVPKNPYIGSDNSQNEQNILGKRQNQRQPDYGSLNASLRSDTIPVVDATHWIDDVFHSLDHESIPDSEIIATKIKGGIDDQLNAGMPIMMPHFVPNPYMAQPMMPMILPNSQMMFNPAANPVMYQQSTSNVDHLFYHVDPQRRKQANDLKVQLETKELEKRVLEMTLQTELLKHRIQDLQNFPSQQNEQPSRQQTILPQHRQSSSPAPLIPKKVQDAITMPVIKNENIAIESSPITVLKHSVRKIDDNHANVVQTEGKGNFQNSYETSDSARKVGKLGKFIWPPENREKVTIRQKTMINPGKLLIHEKKEDEEEVVKIPKVPPKPPPKTKPLKPTRADNEFKKKPVVQNPPAPINSTMDNFAMSQVKMKLEEIFGKGSASEESMTPAEQSDIVSVRRNPPSRRKPLSQFQEISRSTMTYAGVDWVLEIRKEYFSPQEKLENKTAIDLIYRQIVKDGLSTYCVRLTNECFRELRDVFSKLQITSPTGGSSTQMKLLVIEVAKKLPFYFSKVYPVKNNSGNKEIHQLAIGCEGITLLTITDELTFEVFHFIKFEEITNHGLRSKTEFVVESRESTFMLFSPKAVEIQDLIEIHKKEKLELQNTMETYKSKSLSKKGSVAETSGHSNKEVPTMFTDEGVVIKVHAGRRAILVEILPLMSVVDVLAFICNILDINLVEHQQELVLRFEQGQIWTFLMKRLNAFSATIKLFTVPQNKVGTSEVVGETELARGAWVNMIDLSQSSPAYLDLLYIQSISDYLCGYFMPIKSNIVPAAVLEEISILVALQFQIENPNSTVFEEGVEKYLPRNIWSMVDLEYLCPLVLKQCVAVQNLKPDDKKILSLEILSKWPMFGSSFFQAKYFTSENLTSDCILAIHKQGIYFLNEDTNVTMSFCSFKNGICSTIDNGDEDGRKITLWVGGAKGSEKQSALPILSRGREHILALLDLYNSLLK